MFYSRDESTTKNVKQLNNNVILTTFYSTVKCQQICFFRGTVRVRPNRTIFHTRVLIAMRGYVLRLRPVFLEGLYLITFLKPSRPRDQVDVRDQKRRYSFWCRKKYSWNLFKSITWNKYSRKNLLTHNLKCFSKSIQILILFKYQKHFFSHR